MMEEKQKTKIALFQKAPVIKKGDGKIPVGLFVSPTGTDDCAYCPLSPHSAPLILIAHTAPLCPY